MNKLTLLLLFTCCLFYATAQPPTFFHISQGDPVHNINNAFGSIDILTDCSETFEWEFPEQRTLDDLRGMTYLPDSTLLILHLDSNDYTTYHLSKVDISRKTLEVIDSFPRLIIPPNMADVPSGLFLRPKIKAGPDNDIYIADQFLKKYDVSERKLTHLGMPGINGVPARTIQALTFINGELYISISHPVSPNNTIVKANLDNLLYSNLILSTDRFISRFTNMTTLNFDCDSSLTILTTSLSRSLGARFYQLDLENLSVGLLCHKPELFIPTMAHPTEAIRYDCVPILDLNEIDSSGMAGLDYLPDTVCITPNREAFPLESGFPAILTNTVVDSIWIGITDGATDGSKEWIDCTSNCSNSGKGILFKNSGRAANETFLEQIKRSLFYKNIAAPATGGMRQLAFVTFKKSYRSDTSYLWMPVQSGPDAGNDGNISICRDANPIDLFAQLGGTPMQGGSWASGSGFFDPKVDQSGVFQYTVPGGLCPSKTASIFVTVNELPQFSLGSDVVLCSGEEGMLTPNISGSQYEWQNNSSAENLNIKTAGEYWLKLTDSLGCQSRDTVEVTTADNVQKDSLVRKCPGDFITFEGSIYSTDTSVCKLAVSAAGCDSIFCLNLEFLQNYSETEAISICEDEFFTFFENQYSRTGIYEKKLIASNGCDSLIGLDLEVLPLPSVTIEGEREVCYPAFAEISVAEDYPSYFWSNGNTEQNIILETGNHTVSVTDENGCKSSEEIAIRSKRCEYVYIPNAFSPNGDSVNDEFCAFPNSQVTIQSMKIFDRWGGLIFETKNNNCWDGNWKEKTALSGVYVFFVEVILSNGERIFEKGDVTLVR